MRIRPSVRGAKNASCIVTMWNSTENTCTSSSARTISKATYWRKIKNRDYSQQFGRDDLFAPFGPKLVEGSWASCALVCAEMELY